MSLYHSVDLVKDVEDGPRNDTIEPLYLIRHLSTRLDSLCDTLHNHIWSKHGEGLARATLAVHEYGPIESIKQRLDRIPRSNVVGFLLTAVRVQHSIERKLLRGVGRAARRGQTEPVVVKLPVFARFLTTPKSTAYFDSFCHFL